MTVAKAPSPRVPRAPASPAARAPAQGGRPRSLRRRPRAGPPRGLSDDDPAGITTYSILGADHGYQLLWVLAVATVMLVVFHDLGSRLGVVTGRGPMALLRERHGARWARAALVPLVVRQPGDRMRRVRGRRGGDRAGRHQPLSQPPHRRIRRRGAGPAIELHRVEHILLVPSAVFVAYVIAGLLAQPDWSAAVCGLVVPSMPLDRDGLLTVTAMVGTTVAPGGWPSSAHMRPRAPRRERAALRAHRCRQRRDHDRRDAAPRMSRSPARSRRHCSASACSERRCSRRPWFRSRRPARSARRPATRAPRRSMSKAPVFYGTYVAVTSVAAASF